MSNRRPQTRGDDSLTHDCRAFLFDQIELEPGINLSALSDRTAVALSTIRHHLRVLERAEVIRSEKRRGKRRFYPASFDRGELERAIRSGPTPLLEALESLKQPSGKELASELDRDPSTVSHHLTRLEEAGVVNRKRDGKTVTNELTPAAKEKLSNNQDIAADQTALATT